MIDFELAGKIEHIIEKQEDGVMHYITDKFIQFTIYDSVENACTEYSLIAQTKEIKHYIYIVDSVNTLGGIIDNAELIINKGDCMLKDIMITNIISLTSHNTLKDAWAIFMRYGFRAIPVIDDERKLLGVILYKDVMNLKHRFVS
jgi:magnesium transporter